MQLYRIRRIGRLGLLLIILMISGCRYFTLTRETIRVLKEAAPDVPVALGALS
ncbi:MULTISPECIES: hypothetical protein [unclassified Oceanispirochaeta]|uniref:hypothetical protein n=1 Tax=unclassified Oceanispirochaeta TaxID=2635722 RepID=UPI00131445B6|nr:MULTISPECIES: hypothetical protein [unclassified Oceanispirochaeta]MBF9017697.1 hypothetical protein [Oceanispirochaeta sp. M2]NPD72100.1 hypothetical protein [Oceanispirochaeta sp. M1]